MPALWFLLGLGVIMAIVGINEIYEYKKKKEAKENPQPELENEYEAAGSQMTAAAENTEASAGSVEASATSAAVNVSGTADPSAAAAGAMLRLSSVIEQKLAAGEAIFGLPMKACEKMGQDTLIAMDREDNIYVIETALREGSEDMYDQVMSDLTFNRKRIQGTDRKKKQDNDRKVYAIVCSNAPSPLLVAAAEKDPAIRIFAFDITFKSIY